MQGELARSPLSRYITCIYEVVSPIQPEFEIRRKSPRWKKSKGRAVKKVHFPADAIILNAALEGDLDLLKDCIREVQHYVFKELLRY